MDAPAERRRFYLQQGLRKLPIGSGSSLSWLMALPRERLPVNPSEIFGEIPVLVAGGIAVRAYAPERVTKDIDILIAAHNYARACERLRVCGWKQLDDLAFPNASLGLYGAVWVQEKTALDVITSDQQWLEEAFENATYDQTGLRVLGLAYLVLMKLDSARGIDQGDLTRMLGTVDERRLDEIVRVIERHSRDPQATEDVRQYALLGRLEWGS